MLPPFAVSLLAAGSSRPGACGPALVVAAALVVAIRGRAVADRARAAGIAAGVAIGALLVAWSGLPRAPNDVTHLIAPGTTAIEGRITAVEPSGARVGLTVAVERLRREGRTTAASGVVAVTVAHARRAWTVGTPIRAVGWVRRPRLFGNPGEYDFTAVLARRGIAASMFLWDDAAIAVRDLAPDDVRERTPHIVDGVRAAVTKRIAAVAAEPTRGYLAAVLLGEARTVDRKTRAALTRTGLAHVVSVSGFHITVAAGACFVALRWLLVRCGTLPLRIDATMVAALAGTVPVAAYAALAGGSVPAARAFLSYAVLLGALLSSRPPDAARALAAAAVCLAVATPDIAADASFALSFVSVLALILLARRRAAAREPRRAWRRVVADPIIVTLVATVATAPLTAWYFQQVSLIAPVANLLALPLLGPGTLLPGLAAIPLVAIAPALADLLLRGAALAADLGLRIATELGTWRWASIDTPMPSGFEVALCFAVLATLWSRPPRFRPLIVCLGLLAAGDVTYWSWCRYGDPTLRITFLSVGQGDAAVVEAPGGGVLVVDGGGFPGDFDPGERLIAPFLHARKIMRVDVVALSHPQLDHYGGLAYLAEHFAPREVWTNGTRAPTARFADLERAIAAAGTRSVVLRAGDTRRLGTGVVVDVLHPTRTDGLDPNDASLVLRVRFGATAALFTGDVELGAERSMLARAPTALRSDVLKVPHHGSATSSTAAWLAAVAPRVAVISSGRENRFGFPAPAVVRRLRAVGASVWNTAEHGAVHAVSDGRTFAITPFRASLRPKRFVFPTSLW